MNLKIKKLLFIFLFTVISLEISFHFKYQKYSLFFEPSLQEEYNMPAYQALDPLLGYAANPNYTPIQSEIKTDFLSSPEKIKKSENGFILLENLLNNNPIRIVILGSSTTDPYMFSGNWPWQLHQILNENKISHVIYNGALSGYTSTQQLIKLIRDVIYLKNIDILITYSGLTDVFDTGDMMVSHLGIHTYQQYLFELLSGEKIHNQQFKYLPNLQFGMSNLYSKFFPKRKTYVEYGIKNTNVIDTFISNIKIMNAICNLKNIKFYHFLTQVIQNNSQIEPTVQNTYTYPKDDTYKAAVENFYTIVESKLKSESYSQSFFKLLPVNQPLFFDNIHVNDRGNRLIAEKIFYTIKRRIKN